MKATSLKTTPKLERQLLVRLTDTDYHRLLKQAKRNKKEPVDIARDATLGTVERMEQAEQLAELARLHGAGIELHDLVNYVIGRKQVEESQAKLPGIFPEGRS